MHLIFNSFVLQLNVLKDQNLQLQLLHQEQPQPLRLQKAHVHWLGLTLIMELQTREKYLTKKKKM